jgi:tRNA dimethylallyltransferase
LSTNEKIRVPVLLGPTASGKSDAALYACGRLGCEIVSCDSRQIYKKMDIGTAKPSQEESGRVRHWMIDIIEPDQKYSAFNYAQDAAAIIRERVAAGKRVIVCGGSGLYFQCLSQGIGPQVAEDKELREHYRAIAEKQGADRVYAELAAVDPAAASQSHASNLKRNIRALEVYHSTGIPFSELKKRTSPPDDIVFNIIVLFRPREELYSRINARVDDMMKKGLWEEFQSLRSQGYDKRSPGLFCVGYRELFDVEENKATLAQAVDKIKQNTRNYAKRQITWFRHQVKGREVEAGETAKEVIAKAIEEFLLNQDKI